jgi:hypothetical protein
VPPVLLGVSAVLATSDSLRLSPTPFVHAALGCSPARSSRPAARRRT